MKLFQSLLLVSTAALVLSACDKDEVVTQLGVTYGGGNTNLKIVYASAYAVNYSVHLKVNDVRVSGTMTYSTPFPGGGLNTGGSNMPWYLSTAPGDSKITMAVPKAGTNVDSISLFTGTATGLAAGKYYTAWLADTLNKTILKLVEENTATPADGTSRFKFINLIPNLPSADLYWGTTKVASSVAYSGLSPEFLRNKNDTGRWYIRPAGALPTTTALAVYPATSAAPQTIPNQRIMTVYSRGYVGSTGNRVPAISLTFN